jgi:hypothetical protein
MLARQALERALDDGEEITFEGSTAPSIGYPQQYRLRYGEDYGSNPLRVEIRTNTADHPTHVRVEAESPACSATLPLVDLRPVKVGRKRLVLSNEKQAISIKFTLDFIAESEVKVGFSQRHQYRSIYEAREATAFMLSIAHVQSRIRIIDLSSNATIIEFRPEQRISNYAISNLRMRYDLLDKLCFIQQRIHTQFGSEHTTAFDVTNGIPPSDAVLAEDIYHALRNGKIETSRTVSFKVRPSERTVPQRGSVQFNFENRRVNLLGVELPLGKVRATVLDSERFLNALQKATDESRASGKSVPVKLENLAVVEEYLAWTPRNPSQVRIYDIAADQTGYFTLAQALSVGYASADSVEAELRVERCGGNVFRLVQYPPSDHEDLVILWLQTDQKGVFSHDTALALHHLSDILPSRRHITVPPGWDPPPDARLDRGTVLHHAEVDPSEIAWLGPIPFTKPLRTLRDCIDKAVSPDLLEQAIAEAVERGLVTKADAEDLKTRMVKSA